MGEVLKDLTAGTIAGAAQLVVGHPFDTIKVKLQGQPHPKPGELPHYNGAIDATRKTLAEGGVRALFRGMGAPLATVAVYNAVLFSARGSMERVLAHADGSDLTPMDQVVAGMGAGLAGTFVACPTELIKCRLQGGDKALKGPMEVAMAVVRGEGGVLGLYKGIVPTLIREIPGNAAMFGTYEVVKQWMARQQGLKSGKELGAISLVTAGAIAGSAFWAFVYPADAVKSRIQIDDFKNPRYKGTIHCFQTVMANEGLKGLFRGFEPAIVRAVPANATAFLVYELAKDALTKN
ncbi:hypothetical protein WJX84_006372 [Apatococcus fuscideae]|uniref:Mitochondrial carnitine/acylcarnitine carrier-like protein n=1 Tax=Apatococcus fuscideae TaxID=2026836 RepID=A0AAW1THB1_9CHLO